MGVSECRVQRLNYVLLFDLLRNLWCRIKAIICPSARLENCSPRPSKPLSLVSESKKTGLSPSNLPSLISRPPVDLFELGSNALLLECWRIS